MSGFSPKFRLLYYKNVVNRCFLSFIDDRQDCFTKSPDGKYVLSSAENRSSVVNFFEKAVLAEITSVCRPFSVLDPDYTFIIGGCDPRRNMLLKCRSKRFPAKLSRIVSSGDGLKYFLKENDVSVDMRFFNSAFDEVFDKLFVSRSRLLKGIGPERNNVFMIKHADLDCYAVFKILKYVYGGSNCVNVYSDSFAGDRRCLVAVNDLIDAYSVKTGLNGLPEFKKAVAEIREYADGCVESVSSASGK